MLPYQISFELHAYLPVLFSHEATHGEIVTLWQQLWRAGYRLVSREDNPGIPRNQIKYHTHIT